MAMDFALIERLMRMLEASSLTEMDVTEGGMRIRLAKQSGGQAGAVAPIAKPAPTDRPDEPAHPVAGMVTMSAGMAGTFYRAPSPGAAPFVDVGGEIREGDQLAIIEAMKMLNPVEADCDGIIRKIFIEDGGSLEPGTPLFEVEKR